MKYRFTLTLQHAVDIAIRPHPFPTCKYVSTPELSIKGARPASTNPAAGKRRIRKKRDPLIKCLGYIHFQTNDSIHVGLNRFSKDKWGCFKCKYLLNTTGLKSKNNYVTPIMKAKFLFSACILMWPSFCYTPYIPPDYVNQVLCVSYILATFYKEVTFHFIFFIPCIMEN